MQIFNICLVIFILISGCSFEGKTEIFNPDYNPKISVFGVISTDENQEFVIVERTLRLNEDDDTDVYGAVNPIIDDAVVQIIGNQDTVHFNFYKKEMDSLYSSDNYLYKGMYLDINNEFHAQAGWTYTLQVKIPDGRTVTGTTTVPYFPTITNPNTNDILYKQTIKETTVN